MNPDGMHIRHCILYEFWQGKNATEAARSICNAYGERTISARTCQEWFAQFRSKNYDLNDADRSGRPQKLKTDDLEALLDEDPSQSTRELGERLEVDHTTVLRRLHDMGKIQKVGKWVPRQLTDINIGQRLNTCIFLASKFRKKDFLHKIVTGDEKWIYLENPKNKKQWLDPDQAAQQTPKLDYYGKKVLLCIWWDFKGIVYYELLNQGQTINATRYSQQLRRLNQELDLKRPFSGHGTRPLILLHDNAKPHVAIKTQKTIENLGWQVLPHPAYSPDLAPTDYYLFRSLEISVRGRSFENVDDLRKYLDQFFASKPQSYYRDGIRQLPDRWQMVKDNQGNYFNED